MDLTTKNETNNIVARVKKVFWNLNYSPHTTSNDIGLFELEEPVKFSYGISAVKIPTDLGWCFIFFNFHSQAYLGITHYFQIL